MADLPTARENHASVVLGGRLYVMGGYDARRNTVLNVVERFNPDTDTWETVAPMGTGRCRHVAVVLDGKIYVAGGYNGSNRPPVIKSCERYDPDSGAWERMSNPTNGYVDASAVVVGGKLWLAGGSRNGLGISQASVEVFDPASNTWDATKSAMTTERSNHVLAVLNGELHAVGDKSLTVEKYDVQSETWRIVPEMALPGVAKTTCAAVVRMV